MESEPQATPSRTRIDFVDVLRGLAVVFMILWHTIDSWLLPDLRTGSLWQIVRLMGGMAAPLFAEEGRGLPLGRSSKAAAAKTPPTASAW